MVDPTFPSHCQTGKCLYSAQRDKALKSDGYPCEDGLRASLTSCPKDPGATVNYYHTSSSRKAQCLVYYCIFMVCSGLIADTPFRNVLQQLEKLNLRLRAKCRRCDLHIRGQRSKLDFKTNLIKRGATGGTFRDLRHKLLPDGYVELAISESVLFRRQLLV